MVEVDYHEVSITYLIRFYIENALIEKTWEAVAIDPSNDRVVLKIYNYNSLRPNKEEEQ